MPKHHRPRKGSLAFWPRRRASKPRAQVKNWAQIEEPKPVGFVAYKVGMALAIIIDNRANSPTANEKISLPITILEAPPLKLVGAVGYVKTPYGLKTKTTFLSAELPKELARLISMPKKIKVKLDDLKTAGEIRALLATQPKLAGFGRKKPELVEIPIGNNLESQFDFIKNNLGREIRVEEVLKAGNQIDVHSITKGKGIQGPVKRFGLAIRQHKAEKTKRGPGSLGPWTGAKTWRSPHMGQQGYQQRTEYNKWLIKIDKPINPIAGWRRYGLVRSSSLVVKGSIAGPPKRTIIISKAIRPNKKTPPIPPQIVEICL